MRGDLEQRVKAVLLAIVESFIQTGEPVGSRTISKISDLGLSAATIRNVMADLTEQGFLEQPHTSAGRVPTDKGYRYYVNARTASAPVSADTRDMIQDALGDPSAGLDLLLGNTTKVLAELTHFTGIVASPHAESTRLKMVEFLRINPQQIFVVLITQSHMVHSRILRTSEDLSQEFLNSVSRYLNGQFVLKTLVEIRQQVLESLAEEKEQYDQLLAHVVRLSKRAFDISSQRALYVEGQSNILNDFHDIDKIRGLMRALDEKMALIDLLDHTMAESSVNISIGHENKLEYLDECSLVTAKYGTDEQSVGAIGVIGPTRMDYLRVIPIIEYTARALTQSMAHQ
jgi:heat-inducible transcriptional repressor